MTGSCAFAFCLLYTVVICLTEGMSKSVYIKKKVTSPGGLLKMARARSELGCAVRCEREQACDTTTFHQGTCTLYEGLNVPVCSSPLPTVEVLTKANITPETTLDPRSKGDLIKSACCDVAALANGGTLVADQGWSPPRVYHLDHQGVVVLPWASMTNSSSPVYGILVDGGTVYFLQRDGTITKSRIGQLDAAEWTDIVDVGVLRRGAVLHPDLLLLGDSGRGEIFTYNQATSTKVVVKTGLTDPNSVVVTGSGADTLYVVTEFADRTIRIFDAGWQAVRNIGTSGTGDGQLGGPTQGIVSNNNSVLVADKNNNRVSVFNLTTGAFIKHAVTAIDSAPYTQPAQLSLAGQHLWVRFNNNGQNRTALRFLFCEV